MDDIVGPPTEDSRGVRFLAISGHDIAVDQAAQFYTRYLVKVLLSSGKTGVVPRRYREFRALHEAVRALPASDRPARGELPVITSKKWGGANTQELVEKRSRKLQEYMVSLSSVALLFPAVDLLLQEFFTRVVDAGGADEDDGGFGGAGEDAPPAIGHAVPRLSRASTLPTSAGAPSVGPPPVPPGVSRASFSTQPRPSIATPSTLHTGATGSSDPLAAPTASSRAAASSDGPEAAAAGGARCGACDKELVDIPPSTAAPGAAPAATWDVARFCSPQCERFVAAAMQKGFKITAIGGKRQIANAAAVAGAGGGEVAPDSAAGPPPAARLGALRTGASSWWGSARKVLGGGSAAPAQGAAAAATTPRGSGGASDAEQRRGSAAAEDGVGVDGRKDGSGSRGSSNFGAGASSGDEHDPEGGAAAGAEEDDDERQRFFMDRRRERDSARVLTQWGSLRTLVTASKAISVLGSGSASARVARSSDVAAPPPPPPPSTARPLQPPPPPGRPAGTSSSSAAAAPAEVLHQRGFLWKRGGFKGGRKSWKWRYFELRDRTLYYFGASRSVLLGTLSMIKEPSSVALLAAAATVQATGVGPADTEFSAALFARLASSASSFFAVVQEMSTSAAEQLDLPSQLARRDQRPGGGGPNVFMVITPERTLFVGCESHETYAEWVRALRSLISNEQQRLVAVVRAMLAAAAPPSSPSRSIASPPSSRLADSALPHPPASHAASLPMHATHFGGPDGARTVLDAVPEAPEADAVAESEGVAASPPSAVNPRDEELSPSPTKVASPAAHRGAAAAAETPASATEPISFTPTSLTSPAPAAAGTGLPERGGGTQQNWEIQLEDVELEERIGKGAYGEVYRGRLWGTDVAVKRLLSATLTPEVLENLKEEVSVLSQLRLVLYLGACTAPPDVCIVTEWAEHGSLHEQLYDHTVPMSAVNRLGLALQTAQGMCYLHAPRHMIIHRDLKSHNLLLTRDYTVKVADFGLTVRRSAHPPPSEGAEGPGRRPSVSAAATASSESSPHTGLNVPDAEGSAAIGRAPRLSLSGPTHGKGDKGRRFSDAEGGLLAHLSRAATDGVAGGPSAEAGEFYGIQGTPQWMAPEVLEGQKYNGSVDVYSFGIVLCELTSRILPFSDTYKRFDFIDAVLEEGAMPTIPRWCDSMPPASSDEDEEEGSSSGGRDAALPWGWTEDAPHMLGLILQWQADRQPRRDTAGRPSITAASSAAPWPDPLVGGSDDVRAAASGALDNVDVAVAVAEAAFGSGGGGPGGSQRSGSKDAAAAAPAAGPVLGGASEWRIASGECNGGVLRAAIESCLDRDPDRRPTFPELVELLRALLDRPAADLFMQLELPRLREALAYGSDTVAAVAANEILHFASLAMFASIPTLPPNDSTRPVVLAHGAGGGGVDDDSDDDTPPGLAAAGGGPRARAGASGGGGGGDGGGGGASLRLPHFAPRSTAFYPLLPFAPSPCVTMSQMSGVPYIGLATVVEAGPELLRGLAARLRAVDLGVRARLGLPLFCPDLAEAVRRGPGTDLILVRDGERYGVYVRGFTVRHPDPAPTPPHPAPAAAAAQLPPPAAGASGGSAAPGPPATAQRPSVGPTHLKPRGGAAASHAASKAAAKAAAARAAEERLQRRGAVSTASHCLHGFSVLLQVLDAASPAPTAVVADAGEETESGTRLPPTGSTDRLLLSLGSRLVYALATIVGATAISPLEYAFICRPTGGGGATAAVAAAHRGDARYTYRASARFPQLPDFGADALGTAAALLRALWARLPPLRTPIAHAISVVTLHVSAMLGVVEVLVSRAANASAGAAAETFQVEVSEEVVQGRYCGVVIERLGLQPGGLAAAAAAAPGGRGPASIGSPRAGGGGGGGVCQLSAAVGQRLRGAQLMRSDGIILGSVDVDDYDVTLC